MLGLHFLMLHRLVKRSSYGRYRLVETSQSSKSKPAPLPKKLGIRWRNPSPQSVIKGAGTEPWPFSKQNAELLSLLQQMRLALDGFRLIFCHPHHQAAIWNGHPEINHPSSLRPDLIASAFSQRDGREVIWVAEVAINANYCSPSRVVGLRRTLFDGRSPPEVKYLSAFGSEREALCHAVDVEQNSWLWTSEWRGPRGFDPRPALTMISDHAHHEGAAGWSLASSAS